MTELEKAAGYLEMLKREGQLDETALPELKNMYQLTDEQAHTLLAQFKTTPAYKESFQQTLLNETAQFLFLLVVGGCFLYPMIAKNGTYAFSLYAVVFLLGALGVLVFLLKLIREKLDDVKRFALLHNKALPAVVLAGLALGYYQYQFSHQTYLLQPSAWRMLSNLVLSNDCTENSTGGKHPNYYYQLDIAHYPRSFRWYSDAHEYAFHPGLNPEDLRKGDTIQVWINASEQTSDAAFLNIYDLEKNGHVFLDLAARNKKAGKAAENTRNLLGLVFFVSLVAVFWCHQEQQRKQEPVA